VKYIKFEKVKKDPPKKSYWKKATAMFFALVFVMAAAIFAYDGPVGDGYISEAPYWDYYIDNDTYSYPPHPLI